MDKQYIVDGKTYNVPSNLASKFLEKVKGKDVVVRHVYNGKQYNVPLDLETKFLKKISGIEEIPGNQPSSTADATVEQNTTASTQTEEQGGQFLEVPDQKLKIDTQTGEVIKTESKGGSLASQIDEPSIEKGSLQQKKNLIEDLLKDIESKNYENILDGKKSKLDLRGESDFIPSSQNEANTYNAITQTMVDDYNISLGDYKNLVTDYNNAIKDYNESLQKHFDNEEGYFLQNEVDLDEINKIDYIDRKPLEYKLDEGGRRLYFDPRTQQFEKEVKYEYDRSNGIRFASDSYGKILDNIAYSTQNIFTALPGLKDEKMRAKTVELINNRASNFWSNAFSIPLQNFIQTSADILTTDIDGILGTAEVEARKKGEEIMMNAFEKAEELRKAQAYAGKGITGGGDAADVIAGGFGAVMSMGETMIPAMLTRGISLPIQIATPMYVDYNKNKAKSLYGDDKEMYNENGTFNYEKALQKLIQEDKTEIATPLALSIPASALEYVGYKGIMKAFSGFSKNTQRFSYLAIQSNKEGLTEVGQLFFEKLSSSLGSGLSKEEATKVAFNAATGQEGLEMYLNGFIGGGVVSTGGRAINRALRSDNASIKEVDDMMKNISDKYVERAKSKDKNVKEVISKEIQELEKSLTEYIKNKRKVSEFLDDNQKDALLDILSQKDNIQTKLNSFKKQLDEGLLSRSEYGYAVRSLNNQNKKLNNEMLSIQKEAMETAARLAKEAVETQIVEMGLKGKVTEKSAEAISRMKEKGLDSKSASRSFGFIKQNPDGTFEIILNKDKPMVGTAAHEFMHAVLFQTLQGNTDLQSSLGTALEEHVAGLGGDLTKVGQRLAGYGTWIKDKDGNITGFKKDSNFGEEVITILSESIGDGSLKFNEGLFTKIGDILRRFFKGKLGLGKYKFDTGRDVYNFIKDFNVSLKTGKINKAIIQVAKEGAEGKLLDKTKTKKKKKVKRSYSMFYESRDEAQKRAPLIDEINDMQKGAKTMSEFQNEKVFNPIFDSIVNEGGAINNYIKSLGMSPEKTRGTINAVANRLANYNPEAVRKSKKGDPITLGEFIMANVGFGKRDTAKQLFEQSKKKQQEVRGDITDDSGRTIFERTETEGDMSPEEILIAKEEAEAANEKLNKVSKETLEKKLGLDEKADKEFEEALVTAFGTKLPEVNSKKLRTELRKIVADKLRPKIQKIFGREKSYDNFIQNDLSSLLGFIKVDDLIQIERMVGGKKFPNGRKILASSKRITSVKRVRELQQEGLIDKRIKPETGPSLKTRLNPTSKELLAAFRGVGAEKILGYQPPGSMDSGMLGARKDRLAELLTGEIAFNKAIQVAEQQLEKIQAIEEIQNRNIKENYIAELGLTIDRDPTIQQSKDATIEEVDLLENLVSELGIENVLKGGELLPGFPVMSKAAIQTVQKLYDNNIIVDEQVKGFKQSIYKSNIVPEWLKAEYKAVGNLRYNKKMLDKLHRDSSVIAKELGPEVMSIIKYEILGYKNRVMDPAGKKIDKQASIKAGKTIYQKDSKGNFIVGDYYNKLNNLKRIVDKLDSKLPTSLILSDVRLMNKSFPLFKKIEKILALESKKEKLEKLKALKPEIQRANIANIELAKHVSKTIIELVRSKKISAITALNILQAQTSIVSGFRGLSRLDLIDVREGSQVFNESHPQFKEANKYYKDKNYSTTERLGLKGEHLKPNSNTMTEIAELIFKKDINISDELDLIFVKHSQLLTSKFMTDVIDDGPGGKTSTADFNRIKFLKKQDIDSMVSADGRSYQDVLGDIEIRLMELNFVNNINAPMIKSNTIRKAQNNINNTIEAFNKQAELIKKQNQEIQADLEKRGYTFVEKEKKPSETKLEREFNKEVERRKSTNQLIQEDLEARGYKFSKDISKGMSTFDFDETVGVSENFVIAKKGKETKRIASDKWPFVGEQLANDGWKFDFSDFNKVTKGKPGPLFEKMKNQIKKYGSENVFILTARAPQSEQAIHDWLKSNGINIPRKNITGLGNSTGQAKADWMLEKFAEGYNDMYFVDDALPNVKAVKNVLEQLDIKSKVVQAKIQLSKDISSEFNKILEDTMGVWAKKKFNASDARILGVKKGRFNFIIPPSAEDFKGLLYSFLGKGRVGDKHAAFFKEHLLDPYAKGYREWNAYKQAMSDDYKALKKSFKGVSKLLKKKAAGTVYTNDHAVRVYLWDKAGFEIPGISKEQVDILKKKVISNPKLKTFADGLSKLSRIQDGYIEPDQNWVVGSIASDLSSTVLKIGRKQFLRDWIENKNLIFSQENLNKIEATYGTGFRTELEKILYRMETGQNRVTGKDAQVNGFLDWINGSVGAVMFFNMRSATLQTISMVNFINASDNNVFKAAAAFANTPQFIKDFVFIFNSPMLKQRRAGLQIDVSASELTKAFNTGKSKPQAIIAYLLELGFTPTQVADSFAIAMGGSTFYRNRLNKYLKEGMSESKAKEQTWLDFQEIAEETQQSSRPDLISNQQAGPLGRLILAWQNTPMQMTRLTKKKLSDLINRRRIPGYTQMQSDMANISGIIYYGVAQNLWFGALQTGLMFMLFGWDEDEEREEKLEQRVANGALDTLLRGTGIYGAGISTLKNVLLKWKEEREKPKWKRDNLNIAQEAVNLSPPLGTKMRKIMNAVKTEEFNKGVSKEIGFRIENPNLSIAANWTEALTNLPVARILNKANNVEEAITGDHEFWQRIALMSGWSRWSLGVVDKELEKAKQSIKTKKEKAKEIKKEVDKKIKEEINKGKKDQKKKDLKKMVEKGEVVQCSGLKSNGKRCSLTTAYSQREQAMFKSSGKKTWLCPHHAEFKDGMDRDQDGVKEYQCTGTTSSGKRCKNRGEYTGKVKRCYAHQ
jgi:hypothetical protein